jgi:hypothetical protein
MSPIAQRGLGQTPAIPGDHLDRPVRSRVCSTRAGTEPGNAARGRGTVPGHIPRATRAGAEPQQRLPMPTLSTIRNCFAQRGPGRKPAIPVVGALPSIRIAIAQRGPRPNLGNASRGARLAIAGPGRAPATSRTRRPGRGRCCRARNEGRVRTPATAADQKCSRLAQRGRRTNPGTAKLGRISGKSSAAQREARTSPGNIRRGAARMR